MTKILQSHLPLKPWAQAHTKRLPGTQAIGADDWLLRDDAFAAQMALADELLTQKRPQVFGATPQAQDACEELLRKILDWITRQPGYGRAGDTVTRADGITVPLGDDHPLITARRLVQEDLLVHMPQGDEHALVAGVLAFPASWSLHEKLGHPLTRIHRPVSQYTPDIAARVQRLFNGLRVDKPIMRANYLAYEQPDLFHPATEGARRDRGRPPRYCRVERQCLIRLPETDAIVFTVHSFVVPLDSLTEDDRAAVLDHNGPAL